MMKYYDSDKLFMAMFILAGTGALLVGGPFFTVGGSCIVTEARLSDLNEAVQEATGANDFNCKSVKYIDNSHFSIFGDYTDSRRKMLADAIFEVDPEELEKIYKSAKKLASNDSSITITFPANPFLKKLNRLVKEAISVEVEEYVASDTYNTMKKVLECEDFTVVGISSVTADECGCATFSIYTKISPKKNSSELESANAIQYKKAYYETKVSTDIPFESMNDFEVVSMFLNGYYSFTDTKLIGNAKAFYLHEHYSQLDEISYAP